MQADICMVVHNDVTHDSRVLKEAGSLAAQNWRVVVIGVALNSLDMPEVETKSGFMIIRIRPPFLRSAVTSKLGQALAVALTMPALSLRLRQVQARIYHAHDFPGLLQLALTGIIGRSVIYDAHELFFERPLGLPFILSKLIYALRPLEGFLARRVQNVITISDSRAERLSETLGVPLPVVVRNAVDIRHLNGAAVVYPTGGLRSVVHTGNVVRGRHLSELVSALACLPKDIVVVLMGTGPLEAELKAQAQDLGVVDRLSFVDSVLPEAVAPTMAQATIAAVLTTTVGMNNNLSLPNKFFEAIAAGVPMITGPNIEIARLVRHYDMGVICDPFDPTSIAAAIQTLLDPDNYPRYRTNVLKAREELNWEREEHKLINLYRTLLDDTASTPSSSLS